MHPLDPLDRFYLEGTGTMRNVTLSLPVEQVRALLPPGLELGPQEITPAGTHPVILGFHHMVRLRTSWPSAIPSLTYREFGVGIPDTYVGLGGSGPYFYMPGLLLESVLATLGGMTFWGFPKGLGAFETRPGRYAVRYGGRPVATLLWDERGKPGPIEAFDHFEPHRRAIDQPLLGLLPLGVGPCFVVSDFPKVWSAATLRPLEWATFVHTSRVGGLPVGRFPANDFAEGLDASPIGAYELHAPFRISLPYPAMPA